MRLFHKKIRCGIKTVGVLLSVTLCVIFGYGAYVVHDLPSTLQVTSAQDLSYVDYPFVTITPIQESENVQTTDTVLKKQAKADVRLFRTIPLTNIKIENVKRTQVTLCGTPFGMKIYTNGAFVIGFVEVDAQNGSCCPARDGGIQIGDVIRTINGEQVTGNADAARLFEQSKGEALCVEVERDGKIHVVTIQPIYSPSSDAYKAGLWIRDSCAGIGTLTFVTDNGVFGGLGHGITDSDTEQLIPIEYGEIVSVTLAGVTKGAKGIPGELRGYFASDTPIGTLTQNCPQGVFGTLHQSTCGKTIEVALKQEVRRGEVQIYTTVDSNGPQWYSAEIEKICNGGNAQTQNMVIRITDAALLSKTGGIVQGMSGSPILQNGKLIGAVTHVLVNDPTRGYGIFIENMLDAANKVAEEQAKKDAS